MNNPQLNSFMNSMRKGDMVGAKSSIETALYAKLDSAITERKQDIAQKMFQVTETEAEVVQEENEEKDVAKQIKNMRNVKLFGTTAVASLGILLLLPIVANVFFVPIAMALPTAIGIKALAFILSSAFTASFLFTTATSSIPALEGLIKRKDTSPLAKSFVKAMKQGDVNSRLKEMKTHSEKNIRVLAESPVVFHIVVKDLSKLGKDGHKTAHELLRSEFLNDKVKKEIEKSIKKYKIAEEGLLESNDETLFKGLPCTSTELTEMIIEDHAGEDGENFT